VRRLAAALGWAGREQAAALQSLERVSIRRYGRHGYKEPEIRASLGLVLTVLLATASAAAAGPPPAAPDIGPGERLLVIAPHPDDETIAAGGLIQRVHANGGTVRIVLVTAGDGFVEAVVHETGSPRPRPSAFVAYGQQRLREARAAERLLAPTHARLQILGFPDGGLDGLLQAHWWRSSPERSRFTDATDPPYDDQALEPDVPYDGDDLRRELDHIIRETRPTIVALPDPLDRHPDHRAAGLFTLLALRDWAEHRPKKEMPDLLAYLVHWPDWPPGWNAPTPQPLGSVPLELPPGDVHEGGTRVTLVLTDDELATKQAALQKYTTQIAVMGPFLSAFLRRTEPYTLLQPAEMERVAQTIERGGAPLARPHPTQHHYGPR
jgi:LmbE family N-acetylglucosaminyl deacetylase